jgi:hypothetical protein
MKAANRKPRLGKKRSTAGVASPTGFEPVLPH